MAAPHANDYRTLVTNDAQLATPHAPGTPYAAARRARSTPPLTVPRPPAAAGAGRRLAGLAVFLAAGAVLGLAAMLTPAAGGVGTHEQLNLPPCGWVIAAGIPCPTCGMTTSFAHAADGHLLASARTQPMGFLLALGTAMALFLGGYVALTGSPALGRLAGMLTPRVAWIGGGLALLAWVYKLVAFKGLI